MPKCEVNNHGLNSSLVNFNAKYDGHDRKSKLLVGELWRHSEVLLLRQELVSASEICRCAVTLKQTK